MAYGSDGLRSGGGRATDAGQAAESATGRLLGSVIGAGAFGDVTGGDALVTGLDTTREAHARLGHDVSAAHAALTTDARGVADTGDELTATTQRIAAGGGPGSISAGMLG